MEKIKRARGISLVLMFIMVFQLMMPVNFAFGDTLSNSFEGNGGVYHLSDSTTSAGIMASDFSLMGTNEFGEERINKAVIEIKINGNGPGSDGNFTDIPADANVNINFRFDFEAMDEHGDSYDYNKDDYFEFDWPAEIIFNNQPEEGWPLKNADNIVYARVIFDGVKARITFVENVPNANLFVEFSLDGKFEGIDEDDGTDVTINVGFGADTIVIGVNPPVIPPVSITLAKSSELDFINKKIKWTVTVTPEEGKEAKEVVITDYFNNSDNQTFVSGSLIVKDLSDTDVTDKGTLTVNPNDFVYTFNEPISGIHTITYETDISETLFSEDDTSKSFEYRNVVEGKAKDFGPITKSSTQTINWIEKSADAQTGVNSGKIKWTVTINNEEGFLKGKNNLKIIDTITGNHVFDDDSKVQIKFDTNPAKDVSKDTDSGNGMYIIDNNTLTYTFNNDDIGSDFTSAVLTYYTKIVDGGGNNDSGTYKNNAKLIITGISGEPSDSASVGIGKGVIQKSVNGQHTYTKDGVKINWTIYLNKNNQSGIKDVNFADTIPAGLKYVEGSFKYDGSGVTPNVVKNSNGTTTLSYKINGEITGLKIITYQTEVKKDYLGLITNGNASFKNSATVTGTGITGTPKDEVSTNVKNTVITKVVDSENDYDYDTREIGWKITINHNELPLKEVSVTDIIPEGMIFLKDTFRFDGGELSELEQLDLTEGTDGENNTFTFYIGDTDKTHTITFKTKATEQYIEANLNKSGGITFNNKAKLISGGKEVTAEANKKIDNDVVRKEGVRTGIDLVNWYVPINLNKIDLGPIKLSDTLQNELSLDVDSVKLYKLDVGTDGKYKDTNGYKYALPKNNLALDGNNYEIGYENNVFTFDFKEEIGKEVYILEFITFIDATSTVNISNTIYLDGVTVVNNPSSNMGTINVNDTSGFAGSTSAKLTIHKVDENNDTLKLNGAEFELRNSKNVLFPHKSIDENGSYIYEELNLSRYYVKEIKAPDGYLKYDHNAPGEDPKGIQISVNHTEGIEYFFKNQKAEADIVFTKQNNFDKNLSGVEFTLYKDEAATNVAEGPVVSGQDGKVEFKNIIPGTYWIKETGTPTGYIPLADTIKVVVAISSDGTKMEVKFNDDEVNSQYIATNNLIDGVIALKVDENGDYLEGALFGIYEIDGNDSIQQVSSDENGTVLFEDIEEGEYYIKEISPPDGYTKSTDVVSVRVEEDSNDSKKLIVSYKNGDQPYSSETLEFVNNPIDIEFTKHDSNGNPLAGAEFTLYEENGTTVFEDRDPVTSDDDGKVVFTVIPVGKYVIKETKAPSGYRDFNGAIEVEVKVEDEGTVATVTFTEKDKSDSGEVEIGEDGTLIVTNERRPSPPNPIPAYGKIAIKKTDEDKKVLPGAEFTLYDEDGKVVDRGVTGSDGTLSFEDLEPGSYTLKETKAPEGYVLEVDEKGVTVAANRTNTYTFTNKKAEPEKPGRIEIVKVDEEGRLLSEAWFSLIDGNGTTLENVVTVNGRAAFEDVPVGRYTVKEVQAPEGYVLTEQEVNVTVDSEETVTVRFVNKQSGTTVVPVSGRITINKVDENNMALAGAEFTLYNENNEIVGTAVSDASGRVIFENLKDGRYFVRETEAPAGYRLVSDSLTVNVTGGSSHSYRFRNVPDTEDIDDPEIPLGWEEIDDPDVPRDVLELPDTGSLLNTWLMITIGLMLIFAGMFLFRTKLTNN